MPNSEREKATSTLWPRSLYGPRAGSEWESKHLVIQEAQAFLVDLASTHRSPRGVDEVVRESWLRKK